MNSSVNSPSSEQTPDGLKAQLLLCVAAIMLFAMNLFVLGPILEKTVGLPGFNAVYLFVRTLIYMGFGFFMVRVAKRNRTQTFSSAVLIGTFDQVIFKWIWMRQAIRANPADWKDMNLEPTTIFYGLSAGFLYFIPILIILVFLGMELNRFKQDWNRRA